MNAAIGVTGNATFYNSRINKLSDLLGKAKSGSISGGWKEIIALGYSDEKNEKGENVGQTFSVGFGYGGMPDGANWQNTKLQV